MRSNQHRACAMLGNIVQYRYPFFFQKVQHLGIVNKGPECVDGAFVFAGSAFVLESIVFPLAIASVGMGASIIGSFLVRPTGTKLAAALHRLSNALY